MNRTVCASRNVFHVTKKRHIPKKIFEIIDFLQFFPAGLASAEIARSLRGVVRTSGYYSQLSHARIEATRKQIQRARHYLIQTNASIRLDYCKKLRVWRTVSITQSAC